MYFIIPLQSSQGLLLLIGKAGGSGSFQHILRGKVLRFKPQRFTPTGETTIPCNIKMFTAETIDTLFLHPYHYNISLHHFSFSVSATK